MGLRDDDCRRLTGAADARQFAREGKRGEYPMKKTYEKPALVKREKLSAVVAVCVSNCDR